MPKFEEEKVINCLHLDKAEIGKKYYFSDSLYNLKVVVENGNVSYVGELTCATNMIDVIEPFQKDNQRSWEFIYPYEEPPKQRMTSIQLMEWLSKGFGEYRYKMNILSMSNYSYDIGTENMEISNDIRIRPFGQTEWIEPTVDVYERDCKGGK